jgi:hypothetical protein
MRAAPACTLATWRSCPCARSGAGSSFPALDDPARRRIPDDAAGGPTLKPGWVCWPRAGDTRAAESELKSAIALIEAMRAEWSCWAARAVPPQGRSTPRGRTAGAGCTRIEICWLRAPPSRRALRWHELFDRACAVTTKPPGLLQRAYNNTGRLSYSLQDDGGNLATGFLLIVSKA